MWCNRRHIMMVLLATIAATFVSSACAETGTESDNANGAVIKKLANLPSGGILNLTFRSKIDGSLQPLVVKVPKGYTTEKSWPLLVTLHGLGDGPILAREVESMVQIGPYGRGSVWYTGIGEADVFECIEMSKKLFSIDETRIYLCGFSMGGCATLSLGLRYPDKWAACVPVCGRCDDVDFVENARNLPFWVNTGRKDTILPPKYSKNAYIRAKKLGFLEWKYSEHENMGHSFGINWKQIERWLLTQRRRTAPKRVSFCTEDLKSNRAYWVEITEMREYGAKARIDAVIDGQKIDLNTENISNYLLRLDGRLIDISKEIEVVENGSKIFSGFLNSDGCFTKTKNNNCALPSKHPGLSGPLWDVYSSPCILVYGTKSNEASLTKAAKACAESFANPEWMNKVTFKIIPDTAVTEKNIAENNLVLFGNPSTNRILAKISAKLPIQIHGDHILMNGIDYSGENIGYILICPNPLNQQKYVAVFSGNTSYATDCFDEIWPRLDSPPRNIDFGIFELLANNIIRWRLKGIFNSRWD